MEIHKLFSVREHKLHPRANPQWGGSITRGQSSWYFWPLPQTIISLLSCHSTVDSHSAENALLVSIEATKYERIRPTVKLLSDASIV